MKYGHKDVKLVKICSEFVNKGVYLKFIFSVRPLFSPDSRALAYLFHIMHLYNL